MTVSMVLMLGYNTITYYQFFRQKISLFAVTVRSITAWLVGYISFMLLGMVVAFAFAISVIRKDPASFKPEKPATTVQQPHK